MELFNRIFKYKISYLIIIIFIVTFLRQKNQIIDYPQYLDTILFLLTFILLYLINRKLGQIKSIEEKSLRILSLLSIALLTIFLITMLKIPVNYCILKSTFGMQKSEELKIENFISGRWQKLYFKYKGRRESIPFDNKNNLSRNDIIKNYNIKIYYRNSICKTKVIENFELIKK